MRKMLEDLDPMLKGVWAQVRRTWDCPERRKDVGDKAGWDKGWAWPGETSIEDDSNFLDLYRVTVVEGLDEQEISKMTTLEL